jgi:HTH-type transcriptional regulator / antitoxin HigA
MEIKPIRTQHDYQTALHEIEMLMNAIPGSAEEDCLDVLAILVKVYEDERYPILKPSPIAALEYYLESRGLTRKALEPFIGSAHRVSEIMNRRRRLTLEMIRRLEAGIGIPASVLIQPYALVTYSSQVEQPNARRLPQQIAV